MPDPLDVIDLLDRLTQQARDAGEYLQRAVAAET